MTVFGRMSGHLAAARDLALRHDSKDDRQRLLIEAVLLPLDALIYLVRWAHRDTLLGEQGPDGAADVAR